MRGRRPVAIACQELQDRFVEQREDPQPQGVVGGAEHRHPVVAHRADGHGVDCDTEGSVFEKAGVERDFASSRKGFNRIFPKSCEI